MLQTACQKSQYAVISRIERDFASVRTRRPAQLMTKNVIFDLFDAIYATFFVISGELHRKNRNTRFIVQWGTESVLRD